MVLHRLVTRTHFAPRARAFHCSVPRSFLFRSPADIAGDGKVIRSENGAMESRRYLVRGDELGFSMHHEILTKRATPVRLEFRNHVYAVLVTKGTGRLQHLDAHAQSIGSHEHALKEGSFFALSAAEVVEISVESDELHLVSVMNPPLVGPETRNPETNVFPVIDQDGVEREDFDHSLVRRLCEPPESLKGGSSPMKDDPLF